MQIVDAHHHLWDLAHDRVRHPWLVYPIDHPMGDYAEIRKDYLIADLLEDAKGQTLVKSVHLEAGAHPEDAVAETAWLQEIADHPDSRGFPHGIVAHADLAASDVEDVLARHCEYANVRGIRQMLNHDPDEPRFCFVTNGGLMDDVAWRAGYASLERFGLSFDLSVWWPQMEQAARFIADFPNVPVILNHTGMPRRRDADYVAGWRRAMLVLSPATNLTVKISGLGMFDRGWTVDSIRPFILETIGIFGVDRCMFASNFPVDKLMGPYDTLWDAYKEIVADFSEDERANLFHGNAVRAYRL